MASSPGYVPFTNRSTAETVVIVRTDTAPSHPSEERVVRQYDVDEHMLSVDQLMERYTTSPSFGLSSQHATELLNRLGPNALSPPETDSEWIKFLRQFTSPLMVRSPSSKELHLRLFIALALHWHIF